MGRPKTLGPCMVKGCGKDAVSRSKCATHYKQWDRKYGHLRCHWPDCRSHQDDGGRRMNGVFYCRLHEHDHLRITEEAEALNLLRLGHGLIGTAEGCWLWQSPVNGGGYGRFVPEGANTAEWLTHRISWGLLMGGHKPGLQLDHRTCKRPNCANPFHLDPVTPSVNQKRKRHGPEWGWNNPDAVGNPHITQFANEHGLPLHAQASISHIVKRRRLATLSPTTRKTRHAPTNSRRARPRQRV